MYINASLKTKITNDPRNPRLYMKRRKKLLTFSFQQNFYD